MPAQIVFSNLAVPESVFPVLGEEMIATSKNHLISLPDSMSVLRLKIHFKPEKTSTSLFLCAAQIVNFLS